MINSWKVLYSAWWNDECYTPEYAVKPILKYLWEFIQRESISITNWVWDVTVWCPFDTEDSSFVKLLRGEWYNVIVSHISNWYDFFEYEPDEYWDVMISNPPFTNKRKIFERALSFDKPFALIMSNTWLNDAAPKQIFKEKDLQLLMFDKRIKYNDNNKITFSSSYYCYNFLPKQIVMEELTI